MAKKIIHKHGRPRRNSRVLNRESIVDVAFELANEIGIENLSMKQLASKLEIRPPSLYNHIEDITLVRQELTTLTLRKLVSHLQEAVEQKSRETIDKKVILETLICSYRDFAKKFPGVYSAVLPAVHGNSDQIAYGRDLIQICMRAVGIGPELNSENIHKIRILRATLHGFVSLEAAGGFGMPESVDDTFAMLSERLANSLLVSS